MNENRFVSASAFQTGHVVLSCTFAALATVSFGTFFVMMLHLVVNERLPGGMTGLGFLILIPLSVLGVIVAVGYGVVAVFSWWQARHGFPTLAVVIAAFNAFVLTLEAVESARSAGTPLAKTAVVVLAVLSIAICAGLALVRPSVHRS